ncbi:zinc-dependent metalloprotease [Porphyromonas sp.]|uniref:zinc-dependent metalloprotease n=1 Tax=Porphyromonas sp. TaxID=1924944 RepID=UPI0026DCF597|nr:zinc-dependent metalloprotease [Porphyromonas sp.]MDO4770836.1 zinc-dependent metalloprotease [Porphyromonas sp.]
MTEYLNKEGKVLTTQGLLTAHRVGERIYCEIPDGLLGKDLMITHTLLRASAVRYRSVDKKTGYSGDFFGPIVIRLKRVGDQICVYAPLYDRIVSDKSSDLNRIAAQRGNEALLLTQDIVAREEGKTLIEVTVLFRKTPYLNLKSLSLELGLGALQNIKIEDIKGDEGSLIITSRQSYMSSSMFKQEKEELPYIKTWTVGTCITVLPEESLDVIKQSTPSYFYISKEDFEADPYISTKSYFIKRWRLQPAEKDRSRYDRGELIVPSSPIVFHIDSNLPSKWLPYVVEAVEAWRSAFERAGFKEAIHARPITSDTLFDIADSRHPYISWKVSPQKNAYGPHPNEPRAGEIMGSHVGIFSSVLDMLRDWYFVQCGASDPQARSIVLPDSIMGEMIKMVVTHEIGHTLGLEHNFFGSNMASVDQLRDNNYLTEHGITSSVMDYVRCNYALRPGDSVSLKNRISRIGEYDRHIIEYGYRIFSGKNASDRALARQEWLANQKNTPDRVFMAGKDCRSQSEDLGKDIIETNRQGIENLKYLSSIPELWQPYDLYSLRVMQRRIRAMIQSLNQWGEHVVKYVGGCERTDIYGETLELAPISFEKMREATTFLTRYILQPPMWLFDQTRFDKLDLDVVKEAELLYDKIIPHITHRVEDIGSLQYSGYEFSYTVAEYLTFLHTELFSEWGSRSDQGLHNRIKGIMQLSYVSSLIDILDKTKNAIVRVEVWKELNRICDKGRKDRLTATADEQKHIDEIISNIEIEIR